MNRLAASVFVAVCQSTVLLIGAERNGRLDALLVAGEKNTPAPVPERTPKPAPAPVAAVVAEPAPEPDPELDPNQGSKYVCRDHLHPVNWRGHGCPECRADTRRHQRRRAGRAADRRTKTSSTQPERNIS